ncbi:NAD(P)/FAD-dependent oxidoreductase [Nocardioides sp. SOB77]|uniref:Pyridine nucleotide-disulfide oxidoreductase domain-containing protein 2 n=1 Tax=Nocardioides oceani TaxID=3058369 RepID=A0ABT8FA58_9ACTN|nr:NAD(P)/FAD-dependent oxidoreductase [Nocardioides oceani]MDN4171464.1 NAD(P)/FAD-dependent oxidoreductase [Nocardioides oceani]
MTATYDAVVIGAGPNGLVAANHLIDRGWSVLVLEAQPDVGGAVRSDRELHPDYVHDTFSAFYPLAAGSPTIRSFHLEEHGLRWVHSPAVLGHCLPSGEWATLHRDRTVTAALMDAQHPGDGDAWLRLCDMWDTIGDQVVGALLTPFPPLRPALGALAKLPRVGGLEFVREMLTPVVDIGRHRFGGFAPRILLAGNAGHSDIPLGAPGSGLMGLLLTMLGQTVGYPVPEGGAGMLTQAMASRVRSLGGDIRCDAEVVRIEVERGRAVAVRTRDGERYAATHAVVADVAAPHLYGGLVAADDLPAGTMRKMESFELDPGTVKVDWALDGPVPWKSEPPHAPGTFHVADSVEQMSEALHHVNSRTVPARPFMLAGQMTTTDPTRSPAGTESLWAYTHVPQDVARDLGEDPVTGRWDREECERFADRMQARIEELAPGFGSKVVARRVLGPHEMQARNANLIGGALNGGTSQLHQELVFRPVPGLGRSETPVKGLYLGSASAHPGGGVHGACGMNAARAAVAHRRVRRVVRGR